MSKKDLDAHDCQPDLWLFELALVFVRLNHVARVIVNANDGFM
jgi:hypothetical protein